MEYTKLKCINQYKSENINPSKTPNTIFEMYSVPIYETGHPEYLRGDEIASNKVVVQKNDILLCKINPRINRVWVVSDESDKMNIASSEWIVIRNNEYNPEFLAWYFRTPKFQKLMISEVTGIGGSLTRAQPKRVSEYPVPVLEKVKQDEIVNILNKCKLVLTLRKQELILLDKLIKARFVEMFGDPMINPKGFPVKTIGEVSVLNKGVTYSPEDVADEGTIVLRSSNIKGNVFDLEDLVKITKKISTDKYVHENDILMCNRNGSVRLVGKVAMIPKLDENMTFGTFMTIVRSDIYEYLFVFFQMDAFRKQIKFQTAVAINQISLPLLSAVKVPVPSRKLIDEFANFVHHVDKSKFVDITALP